jgi:hypothetical protein
MKKWPIREPEREEHRAGAGVARSPFGSKAAMCSAIVALVGAFLVVDWSTGYLWSSPPRSQWTMVILVGLWMAQADLIAVGTSLVPGNIVSHLSWFMFLTMAMWYCLALGMQVPEHAHHTALGREDVIFLSVLLLVAVAVLRISLWIVKKVLRWRLTRRLDRRDALLQDDRQFHVRDLLFAMFVVSLVLSPLRQVLHEWPWFQAVALKRDVCLGLPIVLPCNLCITLASIWWIFASTRARLRIAVGLLVLCIALTAIEFGAFRGILGLPVQATEPVFIAGLPPPPPSQIEQVCILFLLNLAQCAAVLGSMLVLRALGFRLVRLPAKSATSP